MTQAKTSKRRSSNFFKNLFKIVALVIFLTHASVFAQTSSTSTAATTQACPNDPNTGAIAQCCDGIDNDSDGSADFYGVLNPGGKTYKLPPDPKCLYREDSEVDVKNGSEIIPCTNKCNVQSVFLLINNIIKFFFKYILIPIVVIMLVYAGWTYLTAGGNAGKHTKLWSLLWHIIAGIFIILGAWLVVRVALDALGVTSGLIFFQ